MRSRTSRVKKALTDPMALLPYLREKLINLAIDINNLLVRLKPGKEIEHAYSSTLFEEVARRAMVPTDVNDHLPTLLVEALQVRPKLVVELGVRGGETAFVLERVAAVFGAALVLVDIEDCSGTCTYEKAEFVRSDDVEFASRFEAWCAERRIEPSIDVLHIDTSHTYEHTLAEIHGWFPFLSERAKVFFHDTNLREIYVRKDGSMGRGWNNRRGVIKALETYLGRSFDEAKDFSDMVEGWLIVHHAVCNGLTILERLPHSGR